MSYIFSEPTLSEKFAAEPVRYELDGQGFEGVLVYSRALNTPVPGVVMVPNWMGVTPGALTKAAKIAADRYVVLVADMYGHDIRPQNADQAKAATTLVRSDLALLRRRAQGAVSALKTAGGKRLDPSRIAAAGFCFGGGVVLELARSGAALKAFASFHGTLETSQPADAGNIIAPVLVMHGANDPLVAPEQVENFIAQMKATQADWQVMIFAQAVHSFTDPSANTPGVSQYHPKVTARAFAAMNNLFDEVFSQV